MLSEQILEVKNLKKYFDVGPRQVLKAVDDISFSIKRGSTLVLSVSPDVERQQSEERL